MTLSVYDFFSGCGGTSRGFQNAGLIPAFGLDLNKDCADTFKYNFPDVPFSNSDIADVNIRYLDAVIRKRKTEKILFSGCAPCQPFSKQKTAKPNTYKDKRRFLLSKFGKLIEKYRPDYIFVENVPGIQLVSGNSTLARFKKNLERLGYHISTEIIEAQKYGVPQRRRRLVLLGSKHAKIVFPTPTHNPTLGVPYSTVREWIAHLPPIKAGEKHLTIPNHRAANLSSLNLKRIKATPPEGSRSSWSRKLQLDCHTSSGYTGHTDVYGRMKWDSPATGLTTRCISLSNGRYGHPEQNRAISVREAASLQTFPEDFRFYGSLHSQAQQIGNAVPVLLAEIFGAFILKQMKR